MKYYIVIIKYNYKENWKNAKNNSESRAQNGLYVMIAASVYKTAEATDELRRKQAYTELCLRWIIFPNI